MDINFVPESKKHILRAQSIRLGRANCGYNGRSVALTLIKVVKMLSLLQALPALENSLLILLLFETSRSWFLM